MAEEVIIFGPEWKRVVAELLKAEVELPDQIKKDIKEVAERKAEEARNKIRSFPTHGSKHTGLREEVAQGVSVSSDGGGVKITADIADPEKRNIPMAFDRPQGWKHPLFGNRHHWYRNEGGSWFKETFAHAEDDFERRLTDTLEKQARNIA